MCLYFPSIGFEWNCLLRACFFLMLQHKTSLHPSAYLYYVQITEKEKRFDWDKVTK